jgi:hypothetical protein
LAILPVIKRATKPVKYAQKSHYPPDKRSSGSLVKGGDLVERPTNSDSHCYILLA